MNATQTVEGGARVLNQKCWSETVDLNDLRAVKTTPLGTKHHPVNHGDALEMFKTKLIDNGINVIKERGMLSVNKLKYIYVADVYNKCSDMVLTNGFINYNDKSKAFTMVMGEKVFVCSNECVSHQLRDLKSRHTGNVYQEIRDKMQSGIERFFEFTNERINDINMMKETPFGEKQLGSVILDLHRGSGLSNTNIGKIVEEFDNPSYPEFMDRSAWNFHNACTHVFKRIADPIVRINMQHKMNTYVHKAIDVMPIDDDFNSDVHEIEENPVNTFDF